MHLNSPIDFFISTKTTFQDPKETNLSLKPSPRPFPPFVLDDAQHDRSVSDPRESILPENYPAERDSVFGTKRPHEDGRNR